MTPIELGPNSLLSAPAPSLKKPPYLISLSKSGAKAGTEKFISLDKPELLNGFIQVKGFFSDETEEHIVKGFVEIVSNTPKDKILEMMLPHHRVISIRSLVFNAVKPVNQLNKAVE